jgi:hypothetical protein
MQADFSYDPAFSEIPPGEDPRNPVEITESQLDYLVNEFDTNIYPTVTDYFGVPVFHDGSSAALPFDYYDELGRTIIMISNIGDTYYRDPTFPSFIAGFYWGYYYEYYMDRNIINIDADFWETHLYPTETGTGFVGTVAHEMQHLIHDDYNTDDDTWMNEACSTFAEWLCDYGTPWGDINWYMATPDNSLTEWGDQGPYNILADYGVVFLWAMYLNDYFGPAFLGNFVQSGIPGIAGLETLMFPLTFNEVYYNWRIANLIDTDAFGPQYNYVNLDLSEANPIRQYEVRPKTAMYGSEFGYTYTILDDMTPLKKIVAYGSDYIRFTKLSRDIKGKLFAFMGENEIAAWDDQEPGFGYAGAFNLMNSLLVAEAYVDPADPELAIMTWYDIEATWDFGFVQVSTDDGATWVSLENEYTTYDHHASAHPDVIQSTWTN